MSKSDEAAAMLLGGFNCAQSVLATCGADRGLPRELALRVAQAFGGGIGRTGNLCGALTGAIMAIGLKHAALSPSDAGAKMESARLAEAVMTEFERREGSLLCRDLVGFDLQTADGMKRLKESGIHERVCVKAVRDAVDIVERLLAPKE